MSQTPSQTQTPKDFFTVYTRKELERKLEELNEKLEPVLNAMHSILSLLDDIYSYLYQKNIATLEELDKLRNAQQNLKSLIEDTVDAIVVRELRLDVDIEKYEKRYNVSFPYETERQLGVALVKDKDTVKPVVVYTDYDEIGYYEGEE
jgi:predicted Zn-dependent protease